ncbi:XrtA system polysaccharide chain length determinant [Ideonella sp. DXS22W]|uniref:XrtA system polysaccharide chain length determinant n=1 Tax=Pseudaquabacterium inlustre TaxID=2984192 RepID=A0ABU9CRD5_9BURK
MEELIRQLSTVSRGMWKHRWPGLILAWVVAIIGTVVVFRIPDSYEASARIFVDTQSILKPLMSGLAVQPNIDQQVSMLSRTLISRPNIEKLVRMADLDLKSATKAQQEQLIESLMKSVQIRSTGRDNLYTLSYAEADKDRAKRVIQSMVSIFVESSLGASRKDTDSAKVFLDEQIKGYEAKLEESEARLKEFRIRNIDLQTGDGKDSASRLAGISQQLETAKLELREAENARDAARKQLEAERNPAGATNVTQSLLEESKLSVSTPEIDARLEAQRRSLDAMLQRYTEQHPDVVNVRRLIKDLEEQKRREVAELRKAAAATPAIAGGANASLAQQELSRVMATSEVQVAALKARVAEYQSRYAAAKSSSKVAPAIEAEAAQLNRDYAIIKKNYEDLVARRQSAAMSGELEMASGVVDFRLIDPPRVSPRPVSPNRMLLLPAALVAALVAGLGTALAGSQLRPVFYDAQDLRERTGLPLLGVVSIILSDVDRRRERMLNLRFYAGVGGLFSVFLVAMVTVSILATRQAG